MVKKILFVCKYNRFRSKFAEAYFNSVNKNKKFKAVSAGIIRVNKNLGPTMKKRVGYILDKYGIRLGRRSRGLNMKLLERADKIIVVAKDVPEIVFNFPKWRDKVVAWEIPDELNENKRNINKILKSVQRRVDLLVKENENER